MIEIPLQAIPNQSFNITIENVFYDMSIKETKGVMSCSITRNNVMIQSNARIVPGTFLIPYKYQENGNFYILTANDEYPYYEKFGLSQTLVYFPQDLVEQIRNGTY
jgi:hypothetical protein